MKMSYWGWSHKTLLSAWSTKIVLETWNPAFWWVDFGVWVQKNWLESFMTSRPGVLLGVFMHILDNVILLIVGFFLPMK